jgi:adenosylcobalamin-dependent ribonucleoside-triphosphate reductase
LTDEFVGNYKTKPVNWGYADVAGNAVGEITFLRTYSRKKPDGTKERWWEVCRRVVEGMYSIQKDHAKANKLPWNDHKAQRSAQEAFDRLFELKWTPPGRGLWMMGTPLVNEQRNSAALQNCAFVSTGAMTRTDPAAPFCWLMEASMLGVGVGFDTLGAEKQFVIHEPTSKSWTFQVPDTREGWAESLRHQLDSYLKPGRDRVTFDYSIIRPEGAPIHTFGGTAAGPDPLMRLHRKIDMILGGRGGETLGTKDIVDIANLVGVCVVSGNVRRSALLSLGQADDEVFLDLKNPDKYPERNAYSTDPDEAGWGFMSNNSVEAKVGDDLSHLVDRIARNGEPGVIWLDTTRAYGRLIDSPDHKDHRIAGFNPCSEQPLESGELCTLVETYANRHESVEDFCRTLKFAFLYGKTVTLLPTHWPESNAVMQRNRRIGCSVSGIADFADTHNLTELRTWMNKGYETIRSYDHSYSEWLCVRESIKVTTVKPSGTVSLVAGSSPGVHWTPGGEYFNRAMRFAKDDRMVELFREAGYTVETDVSNPSSTVVVYFPIRSSSKRSEKDVSLFEKANLAVLAQRYWSDNGVSVTLSFDPEAEAQHVGTILRMHEGQLKAVSFLPLGNFSYPQMPYTSITPEEYKASDLKRVDFSPIYDGDAKEAEGEAFCTTDVCLLPAA